MVFFLHYKVIRVYYMVDGILNLDELDYDDDDYVGDDIQNDVLEVADENDMWTYNYGAHVETGSLGNNGDDNDGHDNEEFHYDLNLNFDWYFHFGCWRTFERS